MLRIGEFSRIGRVTIETLRHYDACDLLKPAKVAPSTGYRYYTTDQLPRLNQIVALKDVGFSLDEIAHILRDTLTEDQLRGMLRAQLAVAESTIKSATLRRERIQARLNYLNAEENMPTCEVTLKSAEPFIIASIREEIPTIEQLPQRLGELLGTIAHWIGANRIPSGLPLTIYHNESHTREKVDTECAIMIPNSAADKIAPPPHPITIRQIEAAPHMATAIVTDETAESHSRAYRAIAQWIENHRYRMVGPPQELYYSAPHSGSYTAEIRFPIEKETP